jgi:hypothetical protein
MHPSALEALHCVQEWLLKQLKTCPPRDLALTAQRAAKLGWLAAPGKNKLRRVATRLDLQRADAEHAAARGKPLLHLLLPGLGPEPAELPLGAEWLAVKQCQHAIWEAKIAELSARALAVHKPLYVQATFGSEPLDLVQTEALRRLFDSLPASARVLLLTSVELISMTPAEMEGTALVAEGFPLGASADPRLPERLLRLIAGPRLVFTELRVRLCSAALPGLTACVERGGITGKLCIEHVVEGTQPAECAALFDAMSRPDLAPPWLAVLGLSDGGGEDEEGVMLGTEVVAFIPPRAACVRFSCLDLPAGAEAALAGWPALREASFEYWNFDRGDEHAWPRLPRTLERLKLNMNGGVFTTDQLPLAEQLLRDSAHLPALKTVTLEGFEHLEEPHVAPSEFSPGNAWVVRRGGPPSRALKRIHLQCSPLVARFLAREDNLARWRSHLAESHIGLRLEDAAWGLRLVPRV